MVVTSDASCISLRMEKIDNPLQVMLTKGVKKKLAVKAKKNGRTLSGEARYVLTQYVEGETENG